MVIYDIFKWFINCCNKILLIYTERAQVILWLNKEKKTLYFENSKFLGIFLKFISVLWLVYVICYLKFFIKFTLFFLLFDKRTEIPRI